MHDKIIIARVFESNVSPQVTADAGRGRSDAVVQFETPPTSRDLPREDKLAPAARLPHLKPFAEQQFSFQA
jgi:hypothetical protein